MKTINKILNILMPKKEYTYEEIKPIKDALQQFVDAGVLKKFINNGEWSYQNNPEFKKKTIAEQKYILDKLTNFQ